MTPRPIYLKLLDTTQCIEAPQGALFEVITALWEPFSAPAGPAGATYQVWGEEGSWWLAYGDARTTSQDPWQILNELRNAMMTLSIVSSSGYIPLHSAAAAGDAGLVLFVGPGGSGKTRLTADLVREGWAYFSDDLAPITGTGEVLPFPKPLHIKDISGGSVWSPPPGFPLPSRSQLVPASALGPVARSRAVPRAIVFPHFEPGAKAHLSDMSPAQATGRCLLNVREEDKDRSRALATLGSVCRRAPAVDITYGSSTGAVSLLVNWLYGAGAVAIVGP